MSVIKTEATLLTMIPTDSFLKFPYNEPSIQNQPISINIKKESYSFDDEFCGWINPTALANHQTYTLMNIKTEPDDTQSMQHSNTEIFSQPLLSKIPGAENSVDLKLNQLSTLIFKNKSIDIKDENHYTLDSSPMTHDLETSLISIKDESYGQLENFKEASTDEYLVMISDLETSLISIKDENYRKIEIFENSSLDEDIAGLRNTFCDICDKDLASPKSLKRHCSEVHPGNKSYICNVCYKSFKQQSNLKRHKQTIHLNIRDWKCAHCDKSFGHKSNLKQHEKTVHSKIRDWTCARCDKSFGTKNEYSRHEKTVHLKIRNWKCNHCNKSFSTKSNLKSHSRIHSRDCSEVCDICNKSFRNLQRHKYLVHSERKKKFKCNHCDKAFYTKTDLNRHVAIHSDARDWKCKICGKNFKLKFYLRRHEKIHLTNGSYI